MKTKTASCLWNIFCKLSVKLLTTDPLVLSKKRKHDYISLKIQPHQIRSLMSDSGCWGPSRLLRVQFPNSLHSTLAWFFDRYHVGDQSAVQLGIKTEGGGGVCSKSPFRLYTIEKKSQDNLMIKHQKKNPGSSRRGKEQAASCFLTDVCFVPDSPGTNVSVCSWGRSATFGHCFLKRTRGVNEVQQPLCKNRLCTRHCRYYDACTPMCVCVRACTSPRLFVLWWLMSPSPCYMGHASLSLSLLLPLTLSLSLFIHLCFANRQFVDVSLDLICSVSLWKPAPPWLIAALSRGSCAASGSWEMNLLFGIRTASPRSMLIVSAAGRSSGTGPPPNKQSANGWKRDYELFCKG